MYVDDWEQRPLPSATVEDNLRSAKVTYREEGGKAFRVIVRQKPNQIGFHARLPGDGKPR